MRPSTANSLTVSDLHARLGGNLGLRWRQPQTGGELRLAQTADSQRPVPTVGYLNFIHPPQVQIIGPAEIAYLDSVDDEQRRHVLNRIAGGDTAMVVVAQGCALQADMLRGLQEAGIAIFETELPGHKVSYQLRHYLGRALARQITVHGVFLEILSLGVLITGRPGVGKSELALELINRGHRLVADDAPEFALLGPDDLNGGCPPLLQDFLEVRGLGILNIRAMFGEAAIKRRKQLGLIIHLVAPDDPKLPAPDRLSGTRATREILEVTLPEITLPIAAGHNLAVLVEAACRDHLLRLQGYKSDEEFARHQGQSLGDPCA